MENNTLQQDYNKAIDSISYLIVHYPKAVQELLAQYYVFFQGKPSKSQLSSEVISLLASENNSFATALESLITQFSDAENDSFWGLVAKGAVGLLGGLFKKKKRRSSGGNTQEDTSRRDMQARMRQMEEERRRREAAERQRREEQQRRRLEEERKAAEAAARKRANTMLLIGGGITVVAITAILLLRSPKPTYTPKVTTP